MARAYTVPGVQVVETVNPSVATGIAGLSRVALIGVGKGYESATESVVLTGTTPVTLLHTGLSVAQALNSDTSLRSPLVKLATTQEILNPGTYYIKAGTDPDASVTGDEPYTIERIPNPAVKPTAATSGVGKTGTYVYGYTFVSDRGETGISPASDPIVLSNQGAALTAVAAAPAQAGVTFSSRNVYRKKTVGTGADSLWHLIGSVAGNATTTYTDTAADDFTGVQPPTGVADGDTVQVAYTFTDNAYYDSTLFENFADVVDKYGDVFDANGNINSALSFAARIAFSNGASELILVAAPTNDVTGFSSAADKLKDDETVGFVVPVSGSSAIASAIVTGHIVPQNTAGMYRQAVIGQDGSTTTVAAATLRASALGYANEAVILVSPASFSYVNPNTNREMAVGGQYAAAAVAGMFAARDPQVPLTRKTVGGFTRVRDKRSETEKQQDSQAGLMVIEDKGGVMRVRHGVTTKPGNPNTQEASVVRAKYELARRIHDTLDRNVVGLVAPLDQTPIIVKTIVTGELGSALSEGLISGWNDVAARTLNGDPTTVEVSFEYTPAYPINRVVVNFRINTETGDFDLSL